MSLLVVETGAGLPNSNSYMTVAEATTYHTNKGNQALWVDKPATATLEMYNLPVDGDEVYINGSSTYVFRTTIVDGDEVAIGTTVAEALRNLAAAINRNGQFRVWHSATVVNPNVSAAVVGSTMVVTAKTGGTVGNSITVDTSMDPPNRFTTPTLTGGDDTRERALMAATNYLDNQYGSRWVERRTHQDQALDWPRAFVQDGDSFAIGSDVIPQVIKNAVGYLSLLALQGEVLMPDQAASDRSVTSKSIKVGPIEKSVSYGSGGASPQKKYREVEQLINQFLNPSTRIWRA